MNRWRARCAASLGVTLLLAACQTAVPAALPTVSPTRVIATRWPTRTPTATYTPLPTLTPTATRTPSPTPLPDLTLLQLQNLVRFVAQFQMWEPFDSGTMLRSKGLKLLADHILAHAVRHGLTADEIVRLHVWRDALATSPQAVDEVTRGGAGESSIVLSRRRIVTAGGVVIEEVRGS